MIPSSPHVVVIGAGAVGCVTALRLAREGARVTLIDQGRPTNASSVAAGMLAPASETLLERGDAPMFARLLMARDFWPELAALAPGLELDRSGVELSPGPDEPIAALAARLSAIGAAFEIRGEAALLSQDWRLAPPQALSALRAAAREQGVKLRFGEVTTAGDALVFEGGQIVADVVVIAAGYAARAFAAVAPELARLTPIKGQIAAFDNEPGAGPTVRGPGIYLAPQAGGLRAGATMEPGKDDEVIDEVAIAELSTRAAALRPSLVCESVTGAAGVRAATPDGWPLVGPSRAPGVLLATGARRNGWLLAPMMANLVADHLAGRAQGELAGAFHPARFTR